MKFCTHCGYELEEDSKYCQSCGHELEEKVVVKKEEPVPEKKEIEPQKLILIIGVFLVLFSSFVFGFITWKSMSPLFKLLFFGFEALLFFGISFVFRSINKNVSRLFTILGFIMIPYVLSLIPYYNLGSDYISSGEGLYVYLAILYFATFVFFVIIGKLIKSISMTTLSLVSLLVSSICLALIFSEDIVVITLCVLIYLLILQMVSKLNIFSKNLNNVINYASIGGTYLLTPLMISNASNDGNQIIIILSCATYIINSFVHIFSTKNSPISALATFTIPILLFFTFTGLFGTKDGLVYYLVEVICIALYMVFSMVNKECEIMSLIVTYIGLLLLPVIFFIRFLLYGTYIPELTILLSILLCFNLLNIFVYKQKILHYIVPINLFLTLISLIKWIGVLNIVNAILIISSIFIFVYFILKMIKNKYSYSYLFTSIFMTVICLFNTYGGFNYINILIPVILGISFLLTVLFKEKNEIKIPIYVLLNISVVVVFNKLPVLYSLLIIGGVTLLITLLLSKIMKIDLKPYIMYSEVIILLTLVLNDFSYPIYISIINALLYFLGFYSVIKHFNFKAYRIVYLVFGLLFLTNMIDHVIEPLLLSTIISISSIIIILFTLYLFKVEDSTNLSFISLICVFPYFKLIGTEYSDIQELFLVPVVIYTILITEIYKFKDKKSKDLATLIPLLIVAYLFVAIAVKNYESIISIIFDFSLAAILMVLGAYRKHTTLLITGIALTIVTFVIRLFTILGSLAIIVTLIIIGFALIGIALFMELKKKRQ